MDQKVTPISDAELDELWRLHAAATPGPWSKRKTADGTFATTLQCGASAHFLNESHAKFFVEAHNAFPAILARLEAAERERDAAVLALVKNGWRLNTEALAARDAHQRREGAAEWLENAAREGGYYERSSEGMLEEAKQLREGK